MNEEEKELIEKIKQHLKLTSVEDICEFLGFKRESSTNWRNRGIPSKHKLALHKILGNIDSHIITGDIVGENNVVGNNIVGNGNVVKASFTPKFVPKTPKNTREVRIRQIYIDLLEVAGNRTLSEIENIIKNEKNAE